MNNHSDFINLAVNAFKNNIKLDVYYSNERHSYSVEKIKLCDGDIEFYLQGGFKSIQLDEIEYVGIDLYLNNGIIHIIGGGKEYKIYGKF